MKTQLIEILREVAADYAERYNDREDRDSVQARIESEVCDVIRDIANRLEASATPQGERKGREVL